MRDSGGCHGKGRPPGPSPWTINHGLHETGVGLQDGLVPWVSVVVTLVEFTPEWRLLRRMGGGDGVGGPAARPPCN